MCYYSILPAKKFSLRETKYFPNIAYILKQIVTQIHKIMPT